MIKHFVLLIAFLSSLISVSAQDYKFGKVSVDELQEKVYAKDSSASAAILYRSEKTKFNYVQSMGFQVTRYIQERVKIYNTDGFKFATVKENLYKDKGSYENISGLKAFTYNLIDGKIVKDKLKSTGVFKTELNDFYNQEKFTMPNIKEGSIIEYEYSVVSPFYWSIDEFILQYDIPIKKQEVSITTPEYFVFKPNMKGFLKLEPRIGNGNGKINFLSSRRKSNGWVSNTSLKSSEVNYLTTITSYEMSDVPALKEEPFVNNINNYRSAVKYELQYVKMPQTVVKNYTSTWEDVIRNIYQSTSFGGQLTQGNFFKNDLEVILKDKNTAIEKTAGIFHFVQDRMNWDGYYGYYVKSGVRKAYKEQTGNIADINLMLIAMLNDAGIPSYPVLISTREHGVPMFPTREGFNYVAAYVELDEGGILLDASNKFTKPNLLPSRALNWFGQVVKKDGTRISLPLMPSSLSKQNVVCNLVLGEEGTVTGKQRTIFTDYMAYKHRNRFNDVSEDSYIQKLEAEHSGIVISGYDIKNDKVIGKPVMESYEFTMEDQANAIGDKMYFNPLFYYAQKENPFKLENRYFPIDFSHPWEEKYHMNIIIPEGYVIETLPESINLVLPNNMGSFLYTLKANLANIQLVVHVKVNEAVIPVEHYHHVKEFFNQLIQKQNEQVVLSKV